MSSKTFSKALRLWLLRHTRRPAVGSVPFGGLRRLHPISRAWGGDRGTPVDRIYIEEFLERNALDITGDVLEMGDNTYTLRFGRDRVDRSHILHPDRENPKATIVADLASADHIPSNAFTCIIFTQTLQLIYDARQAVHTLYRILKPGGVLLASLPGISQIARQEMDRWGDYWRFTTLSAQRIFEDAFDPGNVSVESHGNVLTAVAFLHGLAADDLSPEEMEYSDPDYQLLIAVRAKKVRGSP